MVDNDALIRAITFNSSRVSPSIRLAMRAKAETSGASLFNSFVRNSASILKLCSYSPSFAASKNRYAIGINAAAFSSVRSPMLPLFNFWMRSCSGPSRYFLIAKAAIGPIMPAPGKKSAATPLAMPVVSIATSAAPFLGEGRFSISHPKNSRERSAYAANIEVT